MDRSEVLTLITETFTTDSIGQKTPVETTRNIFCAVRSTTRAEFFAAGAAGLNPELIVYAFAPDYNGEKICTLNSKRYAIYRTYQQTDETIELYLQPKAGA